jgi:hypothetical protein
MEKSNSSLVRFLVLRSAMEFENELIATKYCIRTKDS